MRDFKKYSELILSLLMAEKNNELLIKNHQSRPTSSAAFSKANVAFSKNYGREYNHSRGHGRGCGHGRGRSRSDFYNPSQNNAIHKKHYVERHDKGKDVCESSLWNSKDSCYKCGSKWYWSRVCQTPEHLCKLYKVSLKGKEKEVNFTEHDDPMDDSTHLDTSDFTDDFADLSIHRDSMDTGDN